MRKDKKTQGKPAAVLGILLALSAAISGGCQSPDTENETQITDTNFQDSERADRTLPETSYEPLPGVSGEYRSTSSENRECRKVFSESVGGLLTWYGADEEDTGIPFSMETIVYMAADELHDSNGELLCRIQLDDREYEGIYGLTYVSTGVEVRILNAAMEERAVIVEK